MQPRAGAEGGDLPRLGITSGAAFAGALKLCAEVPQGSTVLCMLPDTGERYLSTPLFADIPADMTEDEIGISRSTPGCQFPAGVTRHCERSEAIPVRGGSSEGDCRVAPLLALTPSNRRSR